MDEVNDVTKALAAFGAPSIRYHSFGQGQVSPSSIVLPRRVAPRARVGPPPPPAAPAELRQAEPEAAPESLPEPMAAPLETACPVTPTLLNEWDTPAVPPPDLAPPHVEPPHAATAQVSLAGLPTSPADQPRESWQMAALPQPGLFPASQPQPAAAPLRRATAPGQTLPELFAFLAGVSVAGESRN